MKIEKQREVKALKFGAFLERGGCDYNHNAVRYELAALLETIASQLQNGAMGGIIKDEEDHKIGSWALEFVIKGQTDD